MVREMKNDGDQLCEGNKENFRCSGMKRVRVYNEEEGEQQQEEPIAQNSKYKKLEIIQHSPMVEVASLK